MAGRSSRRCKGSRWRSCLGLRRGANREGARLYTRRVPAPSTRGRSSPGQGSLPPTTTPSLPPLTTNLASRSLPLFLSPKGFVLAANGEREVGLMNRAPLMGAPSASDPTGFFERRFFFMWLFVLVLFRRHVSGKLKCGKRNKNEWILLTGWVPELMAKKVDLRNYWSALGSR